ncbi:MAG TPA: trypsin-like serine protease, partial [Polyangiaceae bacterium]|nr:trypsin-like serine protease [Polyangiaceae bacterium]
MPLFKPGTLGFISLGLVCGAALASCGATDGEPAQQRVQRISGGEQGDTWSAVFGTFMHEQDGVAGCSATLIAKNLLLTARHCVSFTSSRRVICGKSTLGEPVSGDALIAANIPDLARSSRSDWFRGAEVYVPEEGDDSCGFDVALIILTENVPDSVARPAIPRIDREVSAGERYVAVGYGLDELGGSGERR